MSHRTIFCRVHVVEDGHPKDVLNINMPMEDKHTEDHAARVILALAAERIPPDPKVWRSSSLAG